MNKTIKYLLSFLFFIQISCQKKKEHQKTKAMTKYEWLDATSAPLGYPVDVYRGGLESSDGEFTSLYSGTTAGSWGEANRGMNNGEKSIPNHLHVIWVSYAEKIFYEADTDIDYEKMIALFRNGYYTPSDGDDPNPRKENYNQIIVGFAPGGVVVVWLSGGGRQVEIGRYEGKKITIPKSEIDALSPGPQKNMFDPGYQSKIMHEFGIVPEEVAKANEGKPIPYGLWDSYRTEYNWTLVTELPNDLKNKDVGIYAYNGNREELFGETLVQKYPKIIPDNVKWNTPQKRTIPGKVDFSWVDENRYYSEIEFDKNEIFSAFKEVSSAEPNAEIELKVTVNIPKTSASVQLISGKKQVWLKNSKIMVRKTKYKD
ncbi:Protein of unknown function (DUF2931) [Chryseobacterium sp. 52]|uniref:DUF2931 family protein n=1 Tax=Chryseobacterium sp. 52 TaxID=2035213 RepID=UPI000C19C673|nr:DUF2931 family protein [Chryseobacterium sp. 52]PIF46651.1 Protein of unknown function (DUF2931) [Chryseobacterium sp. 52]